MEAEPLLLLGAVLHLSPNFCSNPPKQASQFPLPTQNYHMWIKAKLNHTHFLHYYSHNPLKCTMKEKVVVGCEILTQYEYGFVYS